MTEGWGCCTSTATSDAIRQAYRKLVRKWHPDKLPDHPNAETIFLDIVEAYVVLMDEELRQLYDQGRTLQELLKARRQRQDPVRGAPSTML